MPRELACRACKTLTSGKVCPACQSTDLTENWSGLVIIISPDKSQVAKAVNISSPGRYALRVG